MNMKKVFMGGGIAAVIALVAFVGVSIAFAALTFNGTGISGDSGVVADGSGTIMIGTSSSTAITIGRSGITATFPGTVTITGSTTTLQNLVVSGTCTGCGVGNFTAGGDLSGSSTAQKVVGLQGQPISSSTPLTNQVLMWNGTFWTPTNASTTGGISTINGLSNSTTSIVGAGNVTVSTSSPNTITITGTGSGAITINSLATSTFQIQGRANQITVATSSPNIISLSLPQDIGLTSTPTFGGLLLNGNATTTGNLTILGFLTDAGGNKYVTSTAGTTTTGNWQGTWQGVNSTTFYAASNPNNYISSSTGSTLYYPLGSNPAGYLTSASTLAINGLSSSTFRFNGTANQITIATGTPNVITWSLPQNIDVTSNPTFGGLLLNGNATTTNLTIAGLGTSGLNCLTVNSAGNVATTTCGGSGSSSYSGVTSDGANGLNIIGGIAASTTISASQIVAAGDPVFNITNPTYGCSTTLTDNSTCIEAAAAAAAVVQNGVVYIPSQGGGCFKVTNVVAWPSSASLWIDGCLQANQPGMAAVIQSSLTSALIKAQFFGDGVIDANGDANIGLDLPYAAGGVSLWSSSQYIAGEVTVRDLTVNNPNQYGIRCGSVSAPGGSGCNISNVTIDRPLNVAPAGSVGIYFGNTSDSIIDNALISGYQTGVQIAAGDHDFVSHVHPWNRISSVLLYCFEDNGNYNTWGPDNECDTPNSASSVGLYITGNPASIFSNTFYMGPYGGTNAEANAIQTTGVVTTKIFGNIFHGQASGTSAWAGDIVYGSPSAGASNFSNLDINVTTIQPDQFSAPVKFANGLSDASLTAQTPAAICPNGTGGLFSQFNCSVALLSGGSANKIPYWTSASGISGISYADNAVLVTNSSGVPAESSTLPNGITATTQTVGNNSTDVATDAFVLANAGGGGSSTAFSALTSSTNTTAAMVVGSGASLVPSGTGSVIASAITGSGSGAKILYNTSNQVTGFIAPANNAIVATNGSGVPSESSTLPVGITQSGIVQSAAGSTGGTCSMSTGTTCTITLGHTYTTPVCIATEQGVSATVIAAACSVSGTTVTVTAAASNSATWGALVFGNPS